MVAKIKVAPKVKFYSRVSEDNAIIAEATLCQSHFIREHYSELNKYFFGTYWVQTTDNPCYVCEEN